jgi:DNA-binding MarR family transcriptional regulator
MSKKQEFIKYVNNVLTYIGEVNAPLEPMNEDAKLYWDAFCGLDETGEKPLFTDNGKLILKFLQEHPETPLWKARDIAEGLFISSRAVSGAMRKLVTDGFVEKVGQDPVIYSITEIGKNITID